MTQLPSIEETIFIALASDIIVHSMKKERSGSSLRLTRRFWNNFATIARNQLGSLEMLTDIGNKELMVLIKEALKLSEIRNFTEKFLESETENILGFVRSRCERVSIVESTLKKFSEFGIKVVTILSHEYPYVLRQKLCDNTPPLLYYFGNLKLCNGEGVAIVGSRQPSRNAVVVAQKLAQTCALEGFTVVSGGAKGIDSIAHDTALEHGGNTVVFLSCEMLDILKCAEKKKCSDTRRFVTDSMTLINEGKLLLISAVHPNAKFFTGNAMDRNKFIYTLSRAAFVVAANESGGTINGAMENLKKGYSQLWVVDYDLSGTDGGTPPGNKILMKAAAVRRILESKILSNQFSVKNLFYTESLPRHGLFDFQ